MAFVEMCDNFLGNKIYENFEKSIATYNNHILKTRY